MFGGLRVWSDSAWIPDTFVHPEKKESVTDSAHIKWIQRSRPVIPVLGIMLSTHILGGILFSALTTSWFSNNQTVVLNSPPLEDSLTKRFDPGRFSSNIPRHFHYPVSRTTGPFTGQKNNRAYFSAPQGSESLFRIDSHLHNDCS